MIKKLILQFSILITTCTILKAQQNEPIVAQVHYTFKHLTDTSKKNVVYQEEMLLYLGKNSSLYNSYDKIKQDENIKKQHDEQTKAAAAEGKMPAIVYKDLRKLNPTEIYHFYTEQKVVTNEYLLKNYIYEEPIEKVNWKLSKDTSNISGIHCQKATASFKGRNWIAWFAPALPFEAGPWKLYGLPGLIIEAYDDRKEVQFLFGGFVATNGKLTISIPTLKTIKATKADTDRLRNAMYADPKGFLMSYLQSTGGILQDGGNAIHGLNFKNEVKNTIELK